MVSVMVVYWVEAWAALMGYRLAETLVVRMVSMTELS
jgi:hypothetical protein